MANFILATRMIEMLLVLGFPSRLSNQLNHADLVSGHQDKWNALNSKFYIKAFPRIRPLRIWCRPPSWMECTLQTVFQKSLPARMVDMHLTKSFLRSFITNSTMAQMIPATKMIEMSLTFCFRRRENELQGVPLIRPWRIWFCPAGSSKCV